MNDKSKVVPFAPHIADVLIQQLHVFCDRLSAGDINMTDIELTRILEAVTHEAVTKEQAYRHLRLTERVFNYYVRIGVIPQGRARMGVEEPVWYIDELNAAGVAIRQRC